MELNKYDLVVTDDLAQFIILVNEAMALGYLPLGGMKQLDNGKYCQSIYLPTA